MQRLKTIGFHSIGLLWITFHFPRREAAVKVHTVLPLVVHCVSSGIIHVIFGMTVTPSPRIDV